jgi:hypothetical protein
MIAQNTNEITTRELLLLAPREGMLSAALPTPDWLVG